MYKFKIIIFPLFIAMFFACCSNEKVNLDSLIWKTGEHNGHAYVDLGLSVNWATCNIGADKPEDYGDYFAWGEIESKENFNVFSYCHYGEFETRKKYNKIEDAGIVDDKTELDPCDDVAAMKWGGGWRMPTLKEIEELILETKADRHSNFRDTGITGSIMLSKKNGHAIFFPAAGYKVDYLSREHQVNTKSSLKSKNSKGYYWTSTLSYDPEIPTSGSAECFTYGYFFRNPWFIERFAGLSVRPVLDKAATDSCRKQNKSMMR